MSTAQKSPRLPPKRKEQPPQRRPNSDFQNSLKCLPEHSIPIDSLKDRLEDSRRASELSASSINLLDGSIKSEDLAANVAAPPPVMATMALATSQQQALHNGATYNGRRPPRRSSRFQNKPTPSLPTTQTAAVEQPTSTSGHRDSWNFSTAWDDAYSNTVYDSATSSFNCNASQNSLYHVLDELEELEEHNSSYKQGFMDNSERSGVPGVMDISERSSNYDFSGSSVAPKRGVVRQSSSKAFRRSIQNTLKQDEDLSSSLFRMSCGSKALTGSFSSRASSKSGDGENKTL